MSSVDWKNIKYTETFETELCGLERRTKKDPGCTPEDIEGLLNALYSMQGSEQGGRGELQDTILSATIAAHEHFIAEWRAELRQRCQLA